MALHDLAPTLTGLAAVVSAVAALVAAVSTLHNGRQLTRVSKQVDGNLIRLAEHLQLARHEVADLESKYTAAVERAVGAELQPPRPRRRRGRTSS